MNVKIRVIGTPGDIARLSATLNAEWSVRRGGDYLAGNPTHVRVYFTLTDKDAK
jgi:hypothetical protein